MGCCHSEHNVLNYNWKLITNETKYKSHYVRDNSPVDAFPIFSIYCCNKDNSSLLLDRLPLTLSEINNTKVNKFGRFGWIIRFHDPEENIIVNLFVLRTENETDNKLVKGHKTHPSNGDFNVPIEIAEEYNKLKKDESINHIFSRKYDNEAILICGHGLGATLGLLLHSDFDLKCDRKYAYLFGSFVFSELRNPRRKFILSDGDKEHKRYLEEPPPTVIRIKGQDRYISYLEYYESRNINIAIT